MNYLSLVEDLINKMQEASICRIYIKDGAFEVEIESNQLSYYSKKKNSIISDIDHNTTLSNAALKNNSQEISAQSEKLSKNAVISPLVGVFYSASSPDKEPFVKIGQTVKAGDTLFIIESMKLMNEIQAESDGTVIDILVENGQGVEYGQKIMIIN